MMKAPIVQVIQSTSRIGRVELTGMINKKRLRRRFAADVFLYQIL